MNTKSQSRLQLAIDQVETLPPAEQAELVDIIGKRLLEIRRAALIARVQQSKEELKTGNYRSGDTDALFSDLNS